jgi:histidine triad (HIT) family protein
MPTSVPECPFCRIIQADDPGARQVYRDADVVAFFPTDPATLGHTLVVPRQHIVDIWALDEWTASRLTHVTLTLANVIRKALQPEGLNVIQSNGEAATQTVHHLHVHLVPRWAGDAIGPIWPRETYFTESQKDATWDLLRRACREETTT